MLVAEELSPHLPTISCWECTRVYNCPLFSHWPLPPSSTNLMNIWSVQYQCTLYFFLSFSAVPAKSDWRRVRFELSLLWNYFFLFPFLTSSTCKLRLLAQQTVVERHRGTKSSAICNLCCFLFLSLLSPPLHRPTLLPTPRHAIDLSQWPSAAVARTEDGGVQDGDVELVLLWQWRWCLDFS